MTNNHNIAKPKLTASDMTKVRNLAFRLNSEIEEFIHEMGIEIAEREYDSERDWVIAEDYLFFDVMPVLTDMIFHQMKREI